MTIQNQPSPSNSTDSLEPILEPTRRIIDPHHHLWRRTGLVGQRLAYLLNEFNADTGSGHRIEATVFIECLTGYREDGPEHLRPIGETEFCVELARASQQTQEARIAAIVGRADLLMGARVEEVLAGHLDAGQGLFRGIRHAAAWDASGARISHHNPPPHLYLDPRFREGFSRLEPLGLSFDAWLYHPQIPELTDLARAFPGARIVMDHFGGPMGIGPYAGKRQDVFKAWRRDAALLAQCPNVFIKLGGMAMPMNGYGWEAQATPPSSLEFVAAQGDYYRAAIDLFGPQRAMFESNFPVDRPSVSYRTLWNAFKRIAAAFVEDDKDRLFRGSAAEFYRIGT